MEAKNMNCNVLENGNTEIWTDEYNWISKVLTPMGKASFDEIKQAIEEIKKANPKETHIAVNPHRKEGEPYAIAYINGEIDKAVELYCYTIGETEYLEQNVPNITFNEKTN